MLILPSVNAINYHGSINGDTTPPVTEIILDPAAPTGNNGWYISNVEVTFIATDDESGVKDTYYSINSCQWITYTEPFELNDDGKTVIDYFSIDNAGNIETPHVNKIKMDQTYPVAQVTWTHDWQGNLHFIVTIFDVISGEDLVEFYIGDILQYTDFEAPYEWTINLNKIPNVKMLSFYCYDEAGLYDIASPLEEEITVYITHPKKAIYSYGQKILPFFMPLILRGPTFVQADTGTTHEIDYIEYWVNDELQYIDDSPPFDEMFAFVGKPFSRTKIKVVAYTIEGAHNYDEITIWRFFP
jgi:hypothetical protein